MTNSLPQPRSGEHFAVVDLGVFSDLEQFTFEAPEAHIKLDGKLFLKDLLNLSGAEISINKLSPGRSLPFYHKHRLNEEIYLFISGNGEFQVDDSVFPVREGTVVRVDRDGERCWRNLSAEDLYYIVIQVRAASYTESTIQDGVGVNKSVTWKGKTVI